MVLLMLALQLRRIYRFYIEDVHLVVLYSSSDKGNEDSSIIYYQHFINFYLYLSHLFYLFIVLLFFIFVFLLEGNFLGMGFEIW